MNHIIICISIFAGHYTTCCKKPQSCAPEDGQKFARNMLSWSLEINKTVIVASRWFLFYLTFGTVYFKAHKMSQKNKVKIKPYPSDLWQRRPITGRHEPSTAHRVRSLCKQKLLSSHQLRAQPSYLWNIKWQQNNSSHAAQKLGVVSALGTRDWV